MIPLKILYRILFLVIFLTSISVLSKAQTNANLIAKWNKAKKDTNYINDKNQVLLLNKLAERYFYNQPDSALLFSKEALRLAKIQHDDLGIAKAFNNISKSYYILGSYFPSLTAADDAMQMSQKIGYESGIAIAYNNKGLIYLLQDRMNDALTEFRKSLTYNTKIKDSTKMAANYFNIGLSYDELKDPEKAFKYIKKALNIAESIKDGHINQMALNRMGETYYHTQNYPLAIKYYNLALSFKPYQDDWEKGFAYSGLGQAYYALGMYQQAINNAKISLTFSEQLKASWDAERALTILAKSYAAIKDYKNAYIYQLKSRTYADSLFNQAKDKEINYLHLQEKKAENLKLTKQNELSKQAINFNRVLTALVTVIALFLAVVVILTYRGYKNKTRLNNELLLSNAAIAKQKEEISRQREELMQLNETKTQVFSVIGHDLRSPFASILQALELVRYGDLDKQEQQLVFDGFYKQVTLITGMINNLLVWANSQQMGITLNYEKIELGETVNDVLSIYNTFTKAKSQHIIHDTTEPVIVQADPNHLRIILQNIIGNAIKFTPKNGTIHIFYTHHQAMCAIHIKDNGVGMSDEKLKHLFKLSGKSISEPGTEKEAGTGLGLMLIKQFTEENGGRMEIKSVPNEGSEFIIYFKRG